VIAFRARIRRSLHVKFAAVLAAALAVAAYADTPTLLAVAEQATDTGRGAATGDLFVTLTSTGGFRWAKIEKVTIQTDAKNACTITIERQGYDPKKKMGPSTFDVTAEQRDALIAALDKAGALTLKDANKAPNAKGVDMPEYDVTVSLKGKSNAFHAWGPQLLHDGHTDVVQAIEDLEYKLFPTPRM
jgi:hypothetical protein